MKAATPLKGRKLAALDKSRNLEAELRDYLASVKAGGPTWSRKTEFSRLPDGSGVRRLITLYDGTVEKDETLQGPRWQLMAARMGTGFSQAKFSELLGVSKRTLENWEQGRRSPTGAAATLLRIAAQRPDVLRDLAA